MGHAVATYRTSDPTRTLTIRRRFARQYRKRFRRLRGVILNAIVGKDVFGISGGNSGLQGNVLAINQGPGPRSQAFDFPRTDRKVSEFMEWLEQQIDEEILEVTDRRRIGQSIDQTWQNVYIEDTYKRGVQRATYEMDRAGWDIESIQARGGIGTVLSQPAHADRLGVLYTRAFNELKGITDAMDQQISRVLAQGLADGDGPRLLARKLNSTISGKGLGDLGIRDQLGRFIPAERRAEILARTETIRAHHQGMIQTYKNWGAEGVKVKAELRTAGDQRVCPECDMLEGQFFTLKEAENLIPVHPQCRCIALPARPEDIEDADVVGEEPVIERTEETTLGGNEFKHAPLSDEELEALAEYQAGFANSEVGGFSTLQRYAREGTINPNLQVEEAVVQGFVRNLDSAIKKSVAAEEATVYRGIRDTKKVFGIDDMSDLKEGMKYTEQGFSSTSTSRSTANKFADKLNSWEEPRVLKINLNEGDNALPINILEEIGEKEVILPRGMEFEVTKVTSRTVELTPVQ